MECIAVTLDEPLVPVHVLLTMSPLHPSHTTACGVVPQRLLQFPGVLIFVAVIPCSDLSWQIKVAPCDP